MWLQVLAAAGKHQVLIFVHSRKETAKTAKFLKEEALKEDKLARFMGVKRPPSVGSALAPLLLNHAASERLILAPVFLLAQEEEEPTCLALRALREARGWSPH